MVLISSILAGANWLDKMTGRKISKFAVKNAGKLASNTINLVADKLNKPEWKKKTASITEKGAELANNLLGQDNEITKNLQNATKNLNGEHVDWRSSDDGEKKTSLIPYEQPKQQAYLKNLGGSNYKRFRPSFKRMPLKIHKNSSDVISKKKPGKFSKKKPKRLAKKLNFKK